jgi:hypothetical protein
MPRRRILFRPPDPRRPGGNIDFPLFTYERAWKRLASVIDLESPLSVSRDAGWERVHLTGTLIGHDRPDYWIYRIADNEYFIEERVSHDWQWNAAPGALAETPS